MGNVCVQGGKIEAVKVFGPFGSIDLFEFLEDFRGIIYYPKTVDACISGDFITVLLKMLVN